MAERGCNWTDDEICALLICSEDRIKRQFTGNDRECGV